MWLKFNFVQVCIISLIRLTLYVFGKVAVDGAKFVLLLTSLDCVKAAFRVAQLFQVRTARCHCSCHWFLHYYWIIENQYTII